MIQDVMLDAQYIVTDQGTSDGTQIKYYKDNYWYKIDRYGGEGETEQVVSDILNLSGMAKERFVSYQQVLINGEPGCKSKNFLKEDEYFITLYRLYANMTGKDLATVTARMDYDDAIEYVIRFVADAVQVDIREYLANTFILDAFIWNEDRHFNNLGLVYNGKKFVTAPIFDNGKSLLVGNKTYIQGKTIADCKGRTFAKAFSGNFRLNRDYLAAYGTLHLDYARIEEYIKKSEEFLSDRIKQVLRYQLENYGNMIAFSVIDI